MKDEVELPDSSYEAVDGPRKENIWDEGCGLIFEQWKYARQRKGLVVGQMLDISRYGIPPRYTEEHGYDFQEIPNGVLLRVTNRTYGDMAETSNTSTSPPRNKVRISELLGTKGYDEVLDNYVIKLTKLEAGRSIGFRVVVLDDIDSSRVDSHGRMVTVAEQVDRRRKAWLNISDYSHGFLVENMQSIFERAFR